MRHFPKGKNSKISVFKKNVLRFWSFRYSADITLDVLVLLEASLNDKVTVRQIDGFLEKQIKRR